MMPDLLACWKPIARTSRVYGPPGVAFSKLYRPAEFVVVCCLAPVVVLIRATMPFSTVPRASEVTLPATAALVMPCPASSCAPPNRSTPMAAPNRTARPIGCMERTPESSWVVRSNRPAGMAWRR